MPTIHWGIIAPGAIAVKFATALAAVPQARLQAVAGRSRQRAEDFATRFQAARVHDDQAALLADPDIQAVYIASPHPCHHAMTMAALRAGKAVLVEKPIGLNRHQVAEMVALAGERRVFLMEAMWTRFLPVMERVRSWLADGAIGTVRQIQAAFGFRCGWNPVSRLLDPALGGGALLDVGVYPIALALDLFAEPPTAIRALAHRGETGVDEQTAILLSFPAGGLGVLTCAVRTTCDHRAEICGTEGRIVIEPPFWRSTAATLLNPDGSPREQFSQPHRCNGYEYEIEAVHEALAQGLIEHPRCPHQDSLSVMEICDEVRRQIGLRYPEEDRP